VNSFTCFQLYDLTRIAKSSSSLLLGAINTPIEKTAEEWKEQLTPEQYNVLIEEGTEPPNSSVLNSVKDEGVFSCVACDEPLFTTSTKFESGTGWPSFYSPVNKDAIALSTDFKLILPRTECSCAKCGGHLGHVFDDGPDPTGQRFCMNGVAMKFTEDPELLNQVSIRQEENPYTLGLTQVLPSVIINVILGGLCFNSFAIKMETGLSLSLIDAFPLLLSIYFGSIVVRNCGRMFS